MQCTKFRNGKQKGSCLNVAFHMTRQNSLDKPIEVKTSVNKFTETNPSLQSFSVDLSFGSTKDILAPTVHVCGLFFCSSGDPSNFEFKYEHGKSVDGVLVCNGATSLRILLTSASLQDHITGNDTRSPEEVMPKLLRRSFVGYRYDF